MRSGDARKPLPHAKLSAAMLPIMAADSRKRYTEKPLTAMNTYYEKNMFKLGLVPKQKLITNLTEMRQSLTPNKQ